MANWRMIINGSGDEDVGKLLQLAEQLKAGGQVVTGASIMVDGQDVAIEVAADGSLSLPKPPTGEG